ncbi:MAG: hypothetical protein JRN11_07680 [Nitrososphaerota archaeon]|nr:hypothetical protein [Nitrososphaerota archaeon]MDG6968242.1 hypothetical protein [Nitrososphaerota archaeon]MDG6982916.1 hypothetical protein [Nitrososphaerota archaeon]MDG6987455.1 hypothetical protein [Nitrososphaerota archaeon]MDG7026611.1 hypothetical protein [Nitrososphaerota archaeon]
MVDVEVSVKGIEANKTSDEASESTQVTFNVNSSINESDRGPGFLNLKFSMDIETQPAAARVFVSGTTTLKGKDDEIDQLLAAKEGDGTPTLFMRIYQRVYPTMYLLCGTLRIPYPAPGLLKLNRMASAEQEVAR